MNAIKEALRATVQEGGYVLWGLLLLSAFIYALLAATWGGLRRARQTLRQLEPKPNAGHDFASFELTELAWVKQRIPFVAVLITGAPLLGLLGTVSGMLQTFRGLADSRNGVPVSSVSQGISEALVATQAGLIVAVPAAFFLALLHRAAELTQFELWERWHRSLVPAPRGKTPPPLPLP